MTFLDGGYKYEGESLETTSIIYRYEQMDCEEFEAALRDFAGAIL